MKLFKGYYLKIGLAIVTKALEAVFELMMPLMMARLIDEGIRYHQNAIIYKMSLYIFGLAIMGYLSSIICQGLSAQVAYRVGYQLRKDIMTKIQSFSEREYDIHETSVLVNRATVDVSNVQEMINRVLRLGIRAPILTIGSVVAMASINQELAFTLLKMLPVFVLLITAFMYFSIKGHRSIATSLDQVSKRIGESIQGTRIIRAFSKQNDDIASFKKSNQELRKRQLKVGITNTLSSPLTSLVMNGVLILLVLTSAKAINTGAMSQGQVIAVINYATQLVLTLIITMNIIMIASKGLVSLKRINSILDTEVSIVEKGGLEIESPLNLSFENVSYSYPMENRRVLKNVSFSLEAGKVIALIGLTGSGKSTLVRLIPRLIDCTEGSIRINDIPIMSYDVRKLRNRVGFISQSAQFMSGSLEANILMGRSGDAHKALEHAQGHDLIQKGMGVRIEEGGKNLSGGQRQRINIARELVKKPDILIFDDSFSALDAITDKKLRASLKENYPNISQVIISQRTSTIRDADEILVIDKGEIVARGTHQELLQTSELYKKIDNIQRKEAIHDGT